MPKKKKADSEQSEDARPSADDILVLLERLAKLLRQISHAQGLVPVQWEALRYLARANRFSNAPGAMAQYLGTTKGTISQTVLALERADLVIKTKRTGRGVSLALTPKASALLAKDPNADFAEALGALSDKTARRFSRTLAKLLDIEMLRAQAPRFGTCSGCQHLQVGMQEALHCVKFGEVLREDDVTKLCIAHLA